MTILGIYAEGADPKLFGFSLFDGFSRMSDDLERDFFRFRHNAKALYEPTQKRLRERMAGGDMPSELFWFIHADLSRVEDGSLRLHEGKLLSPVWLLGTPDHRDMGDQCTAEEEICFLRAVMPDINRFWLVDAFAGGGTVPAAELFATAGAGVLLVVFWLIAGSVMLARREIP